MCVAGDRVEARETVEIMGLNHRPSTVVALAVSLTVSLI